LKKLVIFLITALILFTMISCGGRGNENKEDPASKETTETNSEVESGVSENSSENQDKPITTESPDGQKGQPEIIRSTQADIDGDNREEEIEILQYKSNEK